MSMLNTVKGWVASLTELALAIALELLVGNNMLFFGGVVRNITGLVSSLGGNGLAGLIAVGIIIWLFGKK